MSATALQLVRDESCAYVTGRPALPGTAAYAVVKSRTHAALQAHGHPGHGRQGGYLAKKNFALGAYDHMPSLYPEDLKEPYSAAVLDRMNSGNVFEDHIGARLTAETDPDRVVVIAEQRTETGERTEEGKRAKEEATFASYLNPNVDFVFNARIGGRFTELVSEYLGHTVDDEHRVSEPDAIEFGPVMDNGLRAMRFVDVKWHQTCAGETKTPKEFRASNLDEPFFPDYGYGTVELSGALQKDDWMQLAHYYRHAQTLGLVDSEASLWGAVIGKEEILVWARIDEPRWLQFDPAAGRRRKQSALELYDRGFAYGLDMVDNAIARNLDPSVPALVFPEWETGHKEDPWGKVALSEAREFGGTGHITLLPGVTPDKAKPLYDAGIASIGQLAELNPQADVPGVTDVSNSVYQARVTLSGKLHRHPDVDWIDLPRADIEVDFDYEADHVVYQRGVRVTRPETGDVEVHTLDDFTGTDEGEAEVFAAMWGLFTDLVAEAERTKQTICFYHYSHYERTQDVRLAQKHAGFPGVPTVEQVKDLYDSDRVVDLYVTFRSELMWPTMSHSIKDLAPMTGFTWPTAGSNGAESMVWYRAAIGSEDQAVRESNIAELRAYNTADTEAQRVLREFVTGLLHAGEIHCATQA